MVSITITIKELAILIIKYFHGNWKPQIFPSNIFDNEIVPNENFLDYSNTVLFVVNFCGVYIL